MSATDDADNDQQRTVEIAELHGGQGAVHDPAVGCAADGQRQVDDVVGVPDAEQKHAAAQKQLDRVFGLHVKTGGEVLEQAPDQVQEQQPHADPDEDLVHGLGRRKVPLEGAHVAAQRPQHRGREQVQQVHNLGGQPLDNAV